MYSDGKLAAAELSLQYLWTAEEEERRRTGNASPFLDDGVAELARRRAPPLATTSAGEDGRFKFAHLSPGSYVVLARGVDGSGGEAQARLTLDGEREELRIDLVPRTFTLRGLAVSRDGSPWQGTVLVTQGGYWWSTWSDGSWGPPPVAIGSHGRFEVTGLSASQAVLTAISPDGTTWTSHGVVMPHEGEYRLVVDDGTREASGRILDADGSPVASARVLGSSSWTSVGADRFPTISDNDGQFRVRVPSRDGALWVRAAGFAEEMTRIGRSSDGLEVRLRRAARIHGRVTSLTDRAPVHDIRVTATQRSAAPTGGVRHLSWTAVTDAEGHYELQGLPPGPYDVYASAPGRVSASPPNAGSAVSVKPQITVLAVGGDALVDLVSIEAAQLTGQVTDAVGAPVAGANLLAWPSVDLGGATEDEAIGQRSYGLAGDRAVTAGDGSYAFESLWPGMKYRVSVRALGVPSPPERSVDLSSSRIASLDFRCPTPRWVDVTVLDKDSGEPVPRASVSVYETATPDPGEDAGEDSLHFSTFSPPTSHPEVRTDAAGRARVGPVGPGRISVSASLEETRYPHGGRLMDVPEVDGKDLAATVRLTRGRKIAGHILLPDGSPAGGVIVNLALEGKGESTGLLTTEDGYFESAGLEAGRYEVSARLSRDGGFHAEAVVAAGGPGLTLSLEPGVRPNLLLVNVLDPEGRPIPSGEASYSCGSGSYGVHVTEGRAEFDVDRLERGSAGRGEVGLLTIEFARGGDGALLPLGRVRLDGVRTGQVLEVRMPPERTIEGRVVGLDGSAIVGARVRANAMGPPGEDCPVRDEPIFWHRADAVRTAADGRFRIAHLGEGEHRIFVLPPTEFAPPEPVSAVTGASDVTFRLRTAVSPTVTVLGPDGKPLTRARVVVAKATDAADDFSLTNLFASYGPGTEVMTGDDGKARLVGLDPDATYWLGVRGPASRTDLADRVLVETWSTPEVTVRLEVGLVVAGVVRDGTGHPVSGVWVRCARILGPEESRTTRDDGAFRFTGLTAGNVRLDARQYAGSAAKSVAWAERTVAAGREDVVLVLEPGK